MLLLKTVLFNILFKMLFLNHDINKGIYLPFDPKNYIFSSLSYEITPSELAKSRSEHLCELLWVNRLSNWYWFCLIKNGEMGHSLVNKIVFKKNISNTLNRCQTTRKIRTHVYPTGKKIQFDVPLLFFFCNIQHTKSVQQNLKTAKYKFVRETSSIFAAEV